MKQKIRFYAKYLAIFIVLLCITKSPVFAQGNSGNNGQGKLWEKNHE
ncbi:MAG: hypothetical protein ABIJ97_13745 [Bacteroidota bacterium]